ncbi:MAG: dodecin family protein [Parachlamydiales bacterium]|jgi:hypothetical protein
MAVAKVLEIICEGKSIEDALESGVQEVSKTVREVKQINVDHVEAKVKGGKIVLYRVIARVTFVVET